MNDNSNPLVVSYLTLRQMIGWIGLLMPFFVRAGAYVFEGIHSTDSISAYYYTGMRDVFVASLVLAGVLITCYRAPGLIDNVTAIVAGLGAIGIALFPMSPRFAADDCLGKCSNLIPKLGAVRVLHASVRAFRIARAPFSYQS